MLNENQKEAVNHLYGPCLVIAPPGSGKTKCLVERVVHLISVHHQAPEKILVVTFTKDAACEMKERFCKQFVSHGKLPFFGTFHSLFLSILKEEYSITSQNIISAKKAVSLLKKACQICGVKGKHINYMDILKEFSQCINKNIKPNEFCSKFLIDDFEQVFFCYQDLKEKEFVIDFDDMMTKVFQLFCSRNDILQKWKNRFEFILLDEMQDINDLQFQIISLLLNDKKNIFCVGDDDQSIYEFRGSKPEIMLSFKKSFPEAVIISSKSITNSFSFRS